MTSTTPGLLDLTLNLCRRPDADGPTVFCGNRAGAGCPYCVKHRSLAYIKA